MGDYRTTTGEPLPAPARDRRRRFARLMWLGALALALLGVLGAVVRVPRVVVAGGYVTTEDYAEVRPPAAGLVAEILVRTGQAVAAGDLLARLDASAESAALEEARNQWRKAEAELSRREAEIADQKRTLAHQAGIARLRERNAHAKHARARELLERGLSAASAVEDARLQAEVASAELAALLGRDLGVYDRELEVLGRERDSRREAVARAEAAVRQREVRAPVAGQVVRYEFVVGELVKPESVLYEVFGGARQVLKARVDERYATRVAPGQPYRARLAPYGGLAPVWFEGRVDVLRNVIQSEGQKTYRVAYCSFDARGRAVPPGTTAEVRIRAGRVSLWAWLAGD